MIITRLRLKNWKNFKNIDVKLSSRVFVIGPNAAGKSNFLDALRFLRDLAQDGLRSAMDEKRNGTSSVRCLAARRQSDIEILIETKESLESSEIWSYEIAIAQDNTKRAIVVREIAKKDGQIVLDRPDKNDADDPQRRLQTALEQIAANKEFRPLADFFGSISYLHLLPQVVRDSRGFSPSPVRNDPFGRDFLLRLLQTPEVTRVSRLKKILDALKIAVPQLIELEAVMDEGGIPHLLGSYAHWRPNAAKQNESQFSDGTLRLLGLLWSMFEGSGPLLLEEPEISLHPEVVRRLPRLFFRIQRARKKARQIIISTHSDDLLSDKSIGPDEIIRLQPGSEGTTVAPIEAADRAAMSSGLTAADVLLPQAAPKDVDQLVLAFD